VQKKAVIGLGKAGLPLAAVMASSGLSVVGIDTDRRRCEEINRCHNPISEEPGLAAILQKHGGKNLYCTDSYKEKSSEIDTYIIIVPLFVDDTNKPDFSILDRAFDSLQKVLKPDDCVILETTVPIGTVENRFKPILDKAKVPYDLGYSPERIMTGKSISRYQEFPKVVSGISEKSLKRVIELYSSFCRHVIPVSCVKMAEFVKVCEGVFRDTNIALANEIYKVCEQHDRGANKYIVFNGYPLTDKCMTGNRTVFADLGTFLYLNKCSYFGVIPNITTI